MRGSKNSWSKCPEQGRHLGKSQRLQVCERKPERGRQKPERAGGSRSHAGVEEDYPRCDVSPGLGAGKPTLSSAGASYLCPRVELGSP